MFCYTGSKNAYAKHSKPRRKVLPEWLFACPVVHEWICEHAGTVAAWNIVAYIFAYPHEEGIAKSVAV